jgi:hypothetical protein
MNDKKFKRFSDEEESGNYPEYNRTSLLKMPNQYPFCEVDQCSIDTDDGANLRDFSGPESPNNISSIRETNSASSSSCSVSSCCSNEFIPRYDTSSIQRIDLQQQQPDMFNGSFYNNDFPQYSYQQELYLNHQSIYNRPMSFINLNNRIESEYRMTNSHIYFVPTMPPSYFRTNSIQRFNF